MIRHSRIPTVRALTAAASVITAMFVPAQDSHPVGQADSAGPTDSYVAATNRFAFELYGTLASNPGNIMVSPYSIAEALGMTRLGAAGTTASEIDSVFHWNDAWRIEGRKGLVAALAPNKGRQSRPVYQLEVANRIFGKQGFPFEQPFITAAENSYGGGIEPIDFTQTQAARDHINGWVDQQTHGLIPDLLPPPLPTNDTVLALVNAVYFKGSWVSPFKERFTREAPFQLGADNTVEVPMMNTSGTFSHAAGNGYQLIEMPYSGGASMVVLLPDEGHDVAQFGSWTAAQWDTAVAGAQRIPASVALPKFAFESASELVDPLKELGINAAFASKTANFKPIHPREPLYISAVLHNTHITVNEQGTEAAAATAVMLARGGRPQPPKVQFRADRPFLFAIRHQTTGCILFLGRMTDPRSPA